MMMNIIVIFGLLLITVFMGIIAYKLFEKRDESLDNLLNPIKDSLEKFNTKIQDIEKSRVGAYEGLSQQVKSLLETQYQLRRETSNLANALRKPQVRGRWGEIQLQRVVELAGMLEHCDFFQQVSVTTDDARLRPDMVIKLPGNKNIVVDAKVPLSAFLDSLDSTDEAQQNQLLIQHSRLVREHIKKLSQKNYWAQFNPSPEFVVLFLPGETFFSAALEHDPSLIESGVEERVIIATPTTLIALLKAISFGWRQENLAKNAELISQLGKDLAKRITDMRDHFSQVGDKLHKAVEAYNKTAASFESRVLVSARKFQSLNNNPEAEILDPIESLPRNLTEIEKIC
ncbi:MAG TPA: DNA recombination protein RmuC [Gammaproteobacteria bacterium]|nr:DNA recombination protein RmuC [Gammaproteobacteria bacterium]